MTRHRGLLTAAVTALLAGSLLAGQARAAPGDLDPSFSGDGQVTTGFAQLSQGTAVAMMGRKILVAGNTSPSGARDWVFVRYRPGGGLDTTFSGDGRARVDVGEDETLWDVVVLPSGKFVAVGEASGGFTVARFTASGRLDRSFAGGDGVFWSRLGRQQAAATCVGRLSRGRLLVGGSSGAAHSDDFTLVRLTADGRRDRTFGDRGVVVRAFATAADSAVREVHTELDNDWVLAIGNAYGGMGGTDIGLMQVKPSGRLAKDFGGGDGKVRHSIGDSDVVTGAIDQRLGFTLVGGYTVTGGEPDMFVARFNASGGVDFGWGGGDGIVVHDTGAQEYWFDFAPAGRKTVVAGQVNGVAAVARLTASGALDATFGGGGVQVVPFVQGTGSLEAVTRQRDGRIVVAGMAPVPGDIRLATARLLP